VCASLLMLLPDTGVSAHPELELELELDGREKCTTRSLTKPFSPARGSRCRLVITFCVALAVVKKSLAPCMFL
jgi:hypothetical protein